MQIFSNPNPNNMHEMYGKETLLFQIDGNVINVNSKPIPNTQIIPHCMDRMVNTMTFRLCVLSYNANDAAI